MISITDNILRRKWTRKNLAEVALPMKWQCAVVVTGLMKPNLNP